MIYSISSQSSCTKLNYRIHSSHVSIFLLKHISLVTSPSKRPHSKPRECFSSASDDILEQSLKSNGLTSWFVRVLEAQTVAWSEPHVPFISAGYTQHSMPARCGAGRYATMANTLTCIYCQTLQGPLFLLCISITGCYFFFPHRHHMQPEMPGCSRALLLLLLLRGVNIQIKCGEDLHPKVEAEQTGSLHSKWC